MNNENLIWEVNNFDASKPFDSENDNYFSDLNFTSFMFTSDNNLKNEIFFNLPPVNQITLPSSDIT